MLLDAYIYIYRFPGAIDATAVKESGSYKIIAIAYVGSNVESNHNRILTSLLCEL